jgi:hypothetical protein
MCIVYVRRLKMSSRAPRAMRGRSCASSFPAVSRVSWRRFDLVLREESICISPAETSKRRLHYNSTYTYILREFYFDMHIWHVIDASWMFPTDHQIFLRSHMHFHCLLSRVEHQFRRHLTRFATCVMWVIAWWHLVCCLLGLVKLVINHTYVMQGTCGTLRAQ